jgi:hypothetical protein
MSPTDPLSELLVDAREFDRARIAAVLRGRLALDESTSLAIVLPAFDGFDNPQKILAFMLLQKAALLLDRTKDDGVTPILLAEQTGVPRGTVGRLLRELLDAHRISQSASGLYFLSGPQVGAAIEQLNVVANDATHSAATKPRQRKGGSSRRRIGGDEKRGDPSTRPKDTRKSPARKSSRSPTALVRHLLDDGFLDKPRTLAEVQRRLKDRAGHQIPVTTLSPIFTRMLRAGLVDREHTANGVYAYVARKS